MAYASASDVAALCRNLLGSASEFDTSTSPTLTQVTAWLSSGCAAINARYGGAISSATDAYNLATQANALFAAWFAERSRINARVSADERTRADMFKRDFDAILEMLDMLDYADMGITPPSSGAAWAGGISRSDKQTIESNSDRVKPRFSRGMLDDPTLELSEGTTAS